jgi:hypothetical protein
MYSSLAWLKIADPFSIMAILAFVAILAIPITHLPNHSITK